MHEKGLPCNLLPIILQDEIHLKQIEREVKARGPMLGTRSCSLQRLEPWKPCTNPRPTRRKGCPHFLAICVFFGVICIFFLSRASDFNAVSWRLPRFWWLSGLSVSVFGWLSASFSGCRLLQSYPAKLLQILRIEHYFKPFIACLYCFCFLWFSLSQEYCKMQHLELLKG